MRSFPFRAAKKPCYVSCCAYHKKDAGKRLVVVDDAEQIDALDIPHTAGFCTVAADGTVSYYRKEAGI